MGMAVHRSRDAQRGAVLDGSAEQVEQRLVDGRVPDARRGEKKPHEHEEYRTGPDDVKGGGRLG